MDWAGGALAFVLGGLLLALLAEFAVAPRIVARENLRAVALGGQRACTRCSGCARWPCC